MLRQKPLEKALEAYKSSKIHAEEEEERRVDERRRLRDLEEERKESRSKVSGKSGTPKPEDLLVGGDVQTAVGGESLVAREDEEEASPSTPLLRKSEVKGKGKDRERMG